MNEIAFDTFLQSLAQDLQSNFRSISENENPVDAEQNCVANRHSPEDIRASLVLPEYTYPMTAQ